MVDVPIVAERLEGLAVPTFCPHFGEKWFITGSLDERSNVHLAARIRGSDRPAHVQKLNPRVLIIVRSRVQAPFLLQIQNPR
jgi:hypothetical protein